MGISGLLPALKSIQVTKHLSEYSGKTIAVDAYVWLHKGVYSCATELATGKNTHKYVDYAMHRVRLMRHYKIEPYIVFDGGPLPAKKGTESERKKKREENLARGKAFAAQGKHTQARECFVKCIDVTPQMAFQFIKALRAESVPYVVAPYEADAQLAYLERIGIVDGILTEDSDLLVFGCQNVLFKLDVVASTVVSISRSDFGSVSDPSGISLVGWSDTQFRAMTILSGCDYLPSIPGIGLKTACSLLRKWRTAEQVVKAIALEGKKSVPRGYMKQYQLAEKCFLHQRVYCPKEEKLVHLTAIGSDWKEEFDAYVGGDLDPILAKKIALGDADPATYLPMKDINSGFKPRALKPLPAVNTNTNTNTPAMASKGKGKMRESVATSTICSKVSKPTSTGGIFNFFGPNPIIPRATPQTKKPLLTVVSKPVLGVTGKASGKRTLAEVMDQDMERKKKKTARKSYSPLPTVRVSVQSKFFEGVKSTGIQRRHSDGVAGPSRSPMHGKNKENVYIVIDDDDLPKEPEVELDGSDLSLQAQFDVDVGMEDIDDVFSDPVKQEDGYISPSPSYSKDADDLSSPLQPGKSSRFKTRRKWNHDQEPGQTGVVASDDDGDVEDENSFGADAVSSPVSVKRPKHKLTFDARGRAYQTPTTWNNPQIMQREGDNMQGEVLVESTPTPTTKKRTSLYPDIEDVPSPTRYLGPDLRSMLGDDGATELDLPDPRWEDEASGSGSTSATPPSPSPETPTVPLEQELQQPKVVFIDADDLYDEEDDEEARRAQQSAEQAKAVMNGWREKWAHPSSKQPNTNMKPQSSTSNPKAPSSCQPMTKAKPLHSVQAFNLRRNETNVTPAGRYSLANTLKPPRSAPPKFGVPNGAGIDSVSAKKASVKPRRSLLFFEAVHSTSHTKKTVAPPKGRQVVDLSFDSDAEESFEAPTRDESKAIGSSQQRLSQFRYKPT